MKQFIVMIEFVILYATFLAMKYNKHFDGNQ